MATRGMNVCPKPISTPLPGYGIKHRLNSTATGRPARVDPTREHSCKSKWLKDIKFDRYNHDMTEGSTFGKRGMKYFLHVAGNQLIWRLTGNCSPPTQFHDFLG
jgi:hypothetical protein